MTVFRAFPYLYDGSVNYEERYLQTYIRSPRAVIVSASDGGTIVGAATALPLAIPTYVGAVECHDIKEIRTDRHIDLHAVFQHQPQQ